MDAGGGAELCNMRSLICSVSEYMEELQKSMEFNMQGCTLTVRERKNELGDSEEVCKEVELALLFCGQPIRSTRHDGLPICLTG